MLKKCLLILTITIVVSGYSLSWAQDGEDLKEYNGKIIEEQMKNINLDELQKVISDVNSSTNNYMPNIDFDTVLEALVKGEEFFKGSEILNGILKMFFYEVIQNASLLIKILILTIICSILTNIQSTFESNTVGEIAFYICYIVLIGLALKSFSQAMEVGRITIDKMVVFMQALLPTLITLLLVVGGITSSAIFQPIILGTISIVSTMMKDLIIPLVFFSAVIGMVSNISPKIQISKLSGLLRQISIAIVGISLTIFIGIISIQGLTTAKVDGVSIRTAKFAIDKFVPIVGKFLSDAMDTVVGCSMLLKNAVGMIGVIILFLITLIPTIKIISLIFLYKLGAAFVEPISNKRIVACLSEISNSLIVLLAVVASVGIMFFIAITIIVSAGNMTMLFR